LDSHEIEPSEALRETMDTLTVEQFEERMAELCLRSGVAGLPRKPRDRHILLKSVVLTLDRDRDYTEREIGDKLAYWLVDIYTSADLDHVTLRRLLVDTGYLERTADGSSYKVADPASAEGMFVPEVDTVDVYEAIGRALKRNADRKKAFTGNA
jgi:hypothetical protein